MVDSHPSPEMLFDYASGGLSTAEAMVVSCHLTLCPKCRAECGKYETLGGQLFTNTVAAHAEQAGIDEAFTSQLVVDTDMDSVLAGTLAKLDLAEIPSSAVDNQAPSPDTLSEKWSFAPKQLQPYLVGKDWSKVLKGIEEIRFDIPSDGLPIYARPIRTNSTLRAALMRIEGGQKIPRHTHKGQEYTLVLQGGFRDASGAYGAGDFATADPKVEHEPVADMGEPCICLAVTTAPLQLTGLIGRLLSPFLRF